LGLADLPPECPWGQYSRGWCSLAARCIRDRCYRPALCVPRQVQVCLIPRILMPCFKAVRLCKCPDKAHTPLKWTDETPDRHLPTAILAAFQAALYLLLHLSLAHDHPPPEAGPSYLGAGLASTKTL